MRLFAISIALGTSFLIACSFFLVSYLMHYFNPLALTATRMLFAMISLAPFVNYSEITSVKKQSFLMFLTIALAGFLLANLLFMTAVSYGPLTNISLVNASLPLMVLFPACLLARRFPTWREICAFSCAFIGVSLIISNGTFAGLFTPQKGELFMLAANSAAALNLILIQKLGVTFSPVFITFFGGSLGLVFLLPLGLWYGMTHILMSLTVLQWLVLIGLCTFGTSLPFCGAAQSIISLGASTSTLLITGLVPLFVGLLGFLVFGDIPTFIQLCGGMLVLISLPWALGFK